MRYLSLVVVGAAWAVAGCHDIGTPKALGPDTPLALHFDSLSAQAHVASQPKRVAALDLVLRVLADGGYPATVIISQGVGDSLAYNSIAWSEARLKVLATGDSVTDSLMVFVAWRGVNADTIVVARTGHAPLAPQVQSELDTLGMATAVSTDSLASGALVIGNTATAADSGSAEGDFGVFGQSCKFVTVTSIVPDNTGVQCNRELVLWQFGLRFKSGPPSNPYYRWGLRSQYTQGVVIVP